MPNRLMRSLTYEIEFAKFGPRQPYKGSQRNSVPSLRHKVYFFLTLLHEHKWRMLLGDVV